jgi:hypothetical protein
MENDLPLHHTVINLFHEEIHYALCPKALQ